MRSAGRAAFRASGRSWHRDQIAHDLVAIEVVAEAWDRPFHVLRAAGFPVALAGRRIRIPGGEAGAVRAVLGAAGLSAELRQSPATFEEAFVLLARGTAWPWTLDDAPSPKRDLTGFRDFRRRRAESCPHAPRNSPPTASMRQATTPPDPRCRPAVSRNGRSAPAGEPNPAG